MAPMTGKRKAASPPVISRNTKIARIEDFAAHESRLSAPFTSDTTFRNNLPGGPPVTDDEEAGDALRSQAEETVVQTEAPRVRQNAFRNVPNEIMDKITENLKDVDVICFALTSKRNLQLVIAQRKETVTSMSERIHYNSPWPAVMKPGGMNFRGKNDLKELLRRLALWLPEAAMLHCFNVEQTSHKKVMYAKEKPWVKKWWRQWSFARMAIIQKCRGIEQREWKRLYGYPAARSRTRKSTNKPPTVPSRGEREWTKLIKKSEASAKRGKSQEMVLRSKGSA